MNGPRRLQVAAAGFYGLFGTFALSSTLPSAQAQGLRPNNVPGQYIVVLKDQVANTGAAAGQLARHHGLGLGHVYGAAIKGFAATIPDGRVNAVAADPLVKYVEPDGIVTADPSAQTVQQAQTVENAPANFSIASKNGHQQPPTQPSQPAQVVPTGICRIGANVCSTLAGNGSGSVDVDVAVIDSGIDLTHPDLNVVGGASFGKGTSYDDGYGHGTYAAGIIGARDNGFGVVGVAPGCRLWSLRTTDNTGTGTVSASIAAINWVVQQGTIKVAHLGFITGGGYQSLNDAVASAVSHGITCVTSAGSYGADASLWSPACVPGVIAVAILADSDGLPGSLGPATPYGPDDTFASFSNYSNDPTMVDLIAPGVNILSTWLNGGYNTMSCGNAAQAYVAGAAALYLSTHPGASPDAVRTALITAPGVQQIAGIHGETRTYPLLNVSSF
jgi:hypothetical protein